MFRAVDPRPSELLRAAMAWPAQHRSHKPSLQLAAVPGDVPNLTILWCSFKSLELGRNRTTQSGSTVRDVRGVLAR